jgi:hypothetical protein
MAKLKESTYAEWRTVFTLSGELLETVNNIGMEKPVPWIVGECASSCLAVLTDPLHKVYGKVNKFLQKAPAWEVEKIPTYWVDKILLHEPELDDGYFEEIDWLLNLFIKALRTEAVSCYLPVLYCKITIANTSTVGYGGLPTSQCLRAHSFPLPVPNTRPSGSTQDPAHCVPRHPGRW